MNWLRVLVTLALPTCLLAQQAVVDEPPSQAVPNEVTFASGLGTVVFPHQLHIEMEVPCEDCHHETLGGDLEMPHLEYFEDFWIRCETCHHSMADPGCRQKCSACHHGSPTTIADETLSSKVVLHQACWECHPIGTGSDASRGCHLCHQQETRSETK